MAGLAGPIACRQGQRQASGVAGEDEGGRDGGPVGDDQEGGLAAHATTSSSFFFFFFKFLARGAVPMGLDANSDGV
ncbi:hypothetical protein L7F22_003955 [Adiantum nelumboides]|nr:hypothetical protein [Adiantum nelumboides]